MVTFGNITTKLSGSLPSVSFTSVVTNNSRCTQAAFLHFFGERLDPDANKGRQRTVFHATGHFTGCLNGRFIFFVVTPVPVTVFKINPEILDRWMIIFIYLLYTWYDKCAG